MNITTPGIKAQGIVTVTPPPAKPKEEESQAAITIPLGKLPDAMVIGTQPKAGNEGPADPK
jgi:hypothetical protein